MGLNEWPYSHSTRRPSRRTPPACAPPESSVRRVRPRAARRVASRVPSCSHARSRGHRDGRLDGTPSVPRCQPVPVVAPAAPADVGAGRVVPVGRSWTQWGDAAPANGKMDTQHPGQQRAGREAVVNIRLLGRVVIVTDTRPQPRYDLLVVAMTDPNPIARIVCVLTIWRVAWLPRS